jgi:hypothetical protein
MKGELSLTDVQLAARAQKRALVCPPWAYNVHDLIPLAEYYPPAPRGSYGIRFVAWPWSLAEGGGELPVDVDVARAEAEG